MKNIELKVRLDDPPSMKKRIREVGCRFQGKLFQVDTYFNCIRGRLKFREINKREFQLIYYRRPNAGSHKISEYALISFSKKEGQALKELLRDAFGVRVVVVKTRLLWMFGETRVHLDLVDSLGEFLELESQIKGEKRKARKEYDMLIEALGLNAMRKIKGSYSDLIYRKGARYK